MCMSLLSGSFVKKPEEWQTVFVIAAVIHFLGVIFYALFASGELQPWAEPSKEDEDEPPAPAAVAWNPFDSNNIQKTGFHGDTTDYNTV